MTKTEMRCAAQWLRAFARDLKRDASLQTPGRPWDKNTELEQAEYASLTDLARKLDAHARTLPHARGHR